MSNTFAPTGFQFIRNYLNAAPTYQTTSAQISSTNSHTFGKGDVVQLLSTGFIDRSLTTDTVFYGILDGLQYYDTVQQKTIFTNYWAAPSTALAGSVLAKVITDPFAVFLVQGGGSGVGPFVQANFGNNVNFGGNAAPTTGTGISTAYADFATVATTSTLPFRVIGFGQNLNNDTLSANNYIEVMANPGAWTATYGTGV